MEPSCLDSLDKSLEAVHVDPKCSSIVCMCGKLTKQDLHQDTSIVGVEHVLAIGLRQASRQHLQSPHLPPGFTAVDDLEKNLAEQLAAAVPHRRGLQLRTTLSAPRMKTQPNLNQIIRPVRQSNEKVQKAGYQVRKVRQRKSLRPKLSQEQHCSASQMRILSFGQIARLREYLVCIVWPNELLEQLNAGVVLELGFFVEEQLRYPHEQLHGSQGGTAKTHAGLVLGLQEEIRECLATCIRRLDDLLQPSLVLGSAIVQGSLNRTNEVLDELELLLSLLLHNQSLVISRKRRHPHVTSGACQQLWNKKENG
jgi:hypothetical protein